MEKNNWGENPKTLKTKFLGPFTDTTHANKCGFAFQ